MDITLINVTCHCANNKFKVAFRTSSLPIYSELCHCNTCRHSTGMMFIHTVPIIKAPLSSNASLDDIEQKLEDLQHLKTYTKPSGRSTRYFCTVCRSYMFCRTEGGDWNVYTGNLEQTAGIVQVSSHRFVESTVDGGFANHYPVASGIELPRYKSTPDNGGTLPFNWKAHHLLKSQERPLGKNETLSAYCDCKRVNLTLTRVTIITKQRAQWWLVPPKDGQSQVRYLAAHCICDSCRLVNGSLVTSWVYVYRDNVIDKYTSLPVVLDPKEGETRLAGLAQYESSPGIFRESCATCGAKVFYWTRKRKGGPDILDIAAGLIDQEQEGSRADRWFAWTSKVPHPDAPIDKAVLEDLERGLEAFNCYEVNYEELRKPEE